MTWTGDIATDGQLWNSARAGAAEAFGLLFDRHVDAVHRYCAYRTGSYVDADDLTSTVFLRAWQERDRLSLTTTSALPLLYGIAGNVCHHHRRRLRRALVALARLPAERDDGDPADLVANRVDAERTAARARRALDSLPAAQRVVVELCLIGGLDVRTAAAAIGVAEGTAKSRLSRARQTLRQALTAVTMHEATELS